MEAVRTQHSSQHSRQEGCDVDSELSPALPESFQEVTHGRLGFRQVACLIGLLGAALLALATVSLNPSVGQVESSNDVSMEEMSWNPRNLATVLCSTVTCDIYSTPLDPNIECEGPATSADCLDKCCGNIACSAIPGFTCSAALGPTFLTRQISYFKTGQTSQTCKGQAQCEDTCCQGRCADTSCPAATTCQRPFPPERCTPSTCEEQCCYDKTTDDYCGNGLTAWTMACKSCETLTEYCETKLGLDFETTPTEEWNHRAFERVMNGLVEPGCEVKETPRCEDLLKFGILSVFPWHKSGEAVSVNGIDVIAGGTRAVSGGDDKLVFIWRISDGKMIRNYSAHYSKVLTISTFNDATFFCAASETEAIVWRSSGPVDSGVLSMEYTTGDDSVGTTSCVGINTWETAIVGQEDSFTVIWHWKASKTLSVPTNPKDQWKWQIDKDAGFVRWPDQYKGHDSELEVAFTNWRKNLFGLNSRRLSNTSEDVKGRRLRPADRTAPWTNWFTNTRWGDVPVYYYQPDNWGPVTSIAAIPFDTLYAVGYAFGSIRVWITYNGFLKSLIPQAHDGAVNALVSAPAGNILYSGGGDGMIRMWDVFNGKHLGDMYAVFAGPVQSLAVIPGGNNIYSGHATGLLLLWIPGLKKLWCHLDTHAGSVNAIQVNPGVVGQVLVALEAGEARVYQMR